MPQGEIVGWLMMFMYGGSRGSNQKEINLLMLQVVAVLLQGLQSADVASCSRSASSIAIC